MGPSSPPNHLPTDFKQGSADGKIRPLGYYTGFIKDNKDTQRNGRLRVYIPELGGDPASESCWHYMQYASPFAGATPLSGNKDNDKTMQGTQISYGFWAVPPDLDNQVLCCFANGDLSQGYWFACLYQENMNHMVPGVALNVSTKDDINKINLPVVCEYNKKDTDATKNPADPKRPIFEPLHNGLTAQGLYEDPERGPATTSARRESPSQVFGFLTTPRSNTIHIDDDPNNEFIRLRTRSGVQITINETTGFIYMNSKNGNSWFEISDIGIDMYSKRSISLRAEENINLHADQSLIMHGAGANHASGANMTHNSSGGAHQKAAGDHSKSGDTVKHNTNDGFTPKSTKPNLDKASAGDRASQIQAVARTIQGEAGDKNKNQFAVAAVMYNRTQAEGFPNSAYEVAAQGYGTKGVQFEAFNSSRAPNDSAIALATQLVDGQAPSGGSTGNALNFVGGNAPTGTKTQGMFDYGTNIGGNYFSDRFGAPTSNFVAPKYGG